jgi:glycosyltransferase involved in cell wall biosynthesis
MPASITKEDRIAKFSKWYWVFRQVESFNPEIIHINTEFVIAEIGFLYARAHNLPVIYTFHTMWDDYSPNYFPMLPSFFVRFVARGVLKIILFQSYRVIVPTPQIDEVVHNYNHRSKTFLLPTGIEPELFDHTDGEGEVFREKMEEAFPKLKGKRILLFAGRVVKEKNLGFLLSILPEILKKHPEVVLLFAGSGPDLDYFKEEAKKNGLEDNCVFTGYVERRDLALIYRISEVFLLPSLTDTQGLVTLEAMFSGTPVVAIGALGTLMVMGGDNGGFMVKNDADEFTSRVLDLLGDADLRKRKSAEARMHACSWSIEELAKKLAVFYKSTADSYRKDYGESRMPVWGLIMDKRWWRVNNKIFQKRTRQIWHQMRSRLAP